MMLKLKLYWSKRKRKYMSSVYSVVIFFLVVFNGSNYFTELLEILPRLGNLLGVHTHLNSMCGGITIAFHLGNCVLILVVGIPSSNHHQSTWILLLLFPAFHSERMPRKSHYHQLRFFFVCFFCILLIVPVPGPNYPLHWHSCLSFSPIPSASSGARGCVVTAFC